MPPSSLVTKTRPLRKIAGYLTTTTNISRRSQEQKMHTHRLMETDLGHSDLRRPEQGI